MKAFARRMALSRLIQIMIWLLPIDLLGKPVSTFPEHAPTSHNWLHRASARFGICQILK
jgi:hypothetical protein